MQMYKKELDILKKINRFRVRKLYHTDLIDLASNDFLSLSQNKKLLKKAYKRLKKQKYNSSKASLMINGYNKIHYKFEKKLCKINKFESGLVVGSGFLANISLIESLVRKQDILFIDEQYHASGILASKLVQGKVIIFKHNDYDDLESKIKSFKYKRAIIAIEGVYSMGGDIAPCEFEQIANKYNVILLVDEAHSNGVIGKNLLGWFDYWDIIPQLNHIKMGTLGKAFGSYGAYILASKHIISYLENRAKPVIYSTALSSFDTALAYESLKYIVKNKKKLTKQINKLQSLVFKHLNIKTKSLIVPIIINDNKKVIHIQNELLKNNILVGAIRQPTVKQAILRIILRLNINKKEIIKICEMIQNRI
jgi:8-amino-7-oxononanoate synthase